MNLNRFKTKKVDTITTVGECLKKKREEINLPIQDLSKKLRIKLDYIEDLENNNYDKLPPDVYLKGFIRNYARLVGLDPEEIIGLYNREKTIRNRMKKRKSGDQGTKFAMPNVVITPRIITVFFSMLVLLVIGYYFWYQISSFSLTPYLFVSSPSADKIVNVSEITVEGETEASASIKVNGEDVFVDPSGNFKENIALRPGKNVLVIEATNRFGKTAKEEINIIYEKKPEPAPVYNNKEEIYKKNNNVYEGEIEIIGP